MNWKISDWKLFAGVCGGIGLEAESLALFITLLCISLLVYLVADMKEGR